jgi:hypothetical protein
VDGSCLHPVIGYVPSAAVTDGVSRIKVLVLAHSFGSLRCDPKRSTFILL